mmetsp:Transcript_9058/g.13409  ORF Transcript_9058/g.13409 Transcript_9058/m.13409 type:complete len:733 (+) Transcript_9058:722-2920(+)
MCPETGVQTSKQGDMGYGAEYTHVITEQRTWAYSGTINTLEENDKIAETYVFSLGYSKDDDVTVVGVDTDKNNEPFTSGRINHSCDWSKATVHYGVLNYKSLHIPCVQTLPGAIIAPGIPVLTNYGWSFEPEGEFTYCHCYTQYCGGFIEQNLTRNIRMMARFVQPQKYPKLYLDIRETFIDEANNWKVTEKLPTWFFQKETPITIKLITLHRLIERIRKMFPDHTKRVEHTNQDFNDSDDSESEEDDMIEEETKPTKIVKLSGKAYSVYDAKQQFKDENEEYLQPAIDELNRYIKNVLPFMPLYNEEKSALQLYRFGVFWDTLTNEGKGDGKVVYTLKSTMSVKMMILRRFMQYASWVVSRLDDFISQAVKYVKLRAEGYGREQSLEEFLDYETALNDETVYHYLHGSGRGAPLPWSTRTLHWAMDHTFPIKNNQEFLENHLKYIDDETAYYASLNAKNQCILYIPTSIWDYCDVYNYICEKHGPPVIHKKAVTFEPNNPIPADEDIMTDDDDDDDDDDPLPPPYAFVNGATPHEHHYHWIANPWAEVEQGPVIKRYFREPKTEHKNDFNLTRLDVPLDESFKPITGDFYELMPSIEREDNPYFFEQQAVFDPSATTTLYHEDSSSEEESDTEASDDAFPSHIKGHIRMPFLYANPLTRTWMKLFKRVIPPAFTMPILPANNVKLSADDPSLLSEKSNTFRTHKVTPPESPVKSKSKPVNRVSYVYDDDTE